MNGTIGRSRLVGLQLGGMAAQEKVAAGSGFGLRCTEVGGIGMNVEDHVAAGKTDNGIRVSGGIVEEPGARIQGGFCAG